jgi:hypothetical protein
VRTQHAQLFACHFEHMFYYAGAGGPVASRSGRVRIWREPFGFAVAAVRLNAVLPSTAPWLEALTSVAVAVEVALGMGVAVPVALGIRLSFVLGHDFQRRVVDAKRHQCHMPSTI